MGRAGLVGIGAILAILAAAPASAQTSAPSPTAEPSEVVPTAPAKSDAPISTDDQINDWINGAPPLGRSGDDDGLISAAPGRGIHGEAGAFVSNHGYGGYVAATAPVGGNAQVGVAVSDDQYRDRYFHANNRSLAASLRVGPQAQRPADCPEGVLVGNRYVEPLWVGRMRGESDDAPISCSAPAGR